MTTFNNISEASTTPGTNTSVSTVGIQGSDLVSTADDAFRTSWALLAKFYDDFGGVNTVAGTGDAITITTSTVYTALATGMRFGFKPTAANTGAATLNFDAIGAKAIRKISGGTDVALGARDLVVSRRAELIYDSTANSAAGAWILLNPTLEGPYPTGALSGSTLSNGTDATNDIDIAVGTARNSTDSENMALAAIVNKQLDVAWAVSVTSGTPSGGLDQGSIANATYHVHLIKRVDTGVVDAIFSLSHDTSATATMTIATPAVVTMGVAGAGHGLVAGSPIKFSTTGALPTGVTAGTQYYVIAAGLTETAFEFSTSNAGAAVNTTGTQSGVHTCLPGPQLPTNYTLFRRIGSIVRAGAAIVAFWQHGDTFTVSPITERSNTAAAASALLTLTIPVGISVEPMLAALLTMSGAAAVDCAVRIGSADHGSADIILARLITTAADGADVSYALISNGIFSNRSGQIYFSQTNTSGTPSVSQLLSNGWIDRRGRL